MSDAEWQESIALSGDEMLGSFANAFRVLEAEDSECLLDFLLYSAIEDRATVVARVRVPEAFLPTIRARLDEVLVETTLLACLSDDCLH